MEGEPPRTSLPIIGFILIIIGASLLTTPILDLAHRGRNPSQRDYLLIGSQYSKYCGTAEGETAKLCTQLRITNYASYGLLLLGGILLVWGLIKKKTSYTKKDVFVYLVTIIVCGFLFFTLHSYHLERVVEKNPIEIQDEEIIEHETTYAGQEETYDLLPVEEVTYFDNKGNKLEELQIVRTETGAGNPCRPWAEVSNPNDIPIKFDAELNYTVYDIISSSRIVQEPNQEIKAKGTTKIVHFEPEEGDPTCKITAGKFHFHEDENVKKKVVTTYKNVTRVVAINKTPEVYNKTRVKTRTEYIETTRLMGKWWWE